MRIAVVIPVVDEEARIGARLDELAARGFDETIVVDGGSRDRTVAIARCYPAVHVIATSGGRGPQQNAGARETTADVLLFLHADTCLPVDARRWIERTLADPAVVGGAFRVRTVADAGRNWLGPVLRLADVRSRVTRLPYGDQAIFVRHQTFRAVGGFPAEPLMEDVGLSRRLRAAGRLVTVPATVEVSGRRFLQRPIRGTLAMWTFPSLHRLGVPPRVLARWYGNPR